MAAVLEDERRVPLTTLAHVGRAVHKVKVLAPALLGGREGKRVGSGPGPSTACSCAQGPAGSPGTAEAVKPYALDTDQPGLSSTPYRWEDGGPGTGEGARGHRDQLSHFTDNKETEPGDGNAAQHK